MRLKRISLFLFFILPVLLFFQVAAAQQSVNAGGSDAKGAGGSVAYSVGQLVFTTNSSILGNVAQGVQHAYEIFTVSTEDSELNISVSIFPNPVSDALTLNVDGHENESLSFEMTDIHGRMVQKATLAPGTIQIEMSAHPASTYFIHMMNSKNKKIKTFKIIKR